MKTIHVQVSDESVVSTAISEMNRQIPDSTRSLPEFTLLYEQATACIEDFVTKAKNLAKSGTTIHIEKEFEFPELSILIVLDYPQKTGFIDKLKRIFKRG